MTNEDKLFKCCGKWFTLEQAVTMANVAVEMVILGKRSEAEHGGGDHTDWEDVDAVWRDVVEAMPSGPGSGRYGFTYEYEGLPPSAGQAITTIHGVAVTLQQLYGMVFGALELNEAYDRGERNDATMDWSDVEAAQSTTEEAMPQALKDLVVRVARERNGYEDEGRVEAGGAQDSALVERSR